MRNSIILILSVITILFLGSCGIANRVAISSSIGQYKMASGQINIGDPKTKVLAILSPTQKNLFYSSGKRPESYLNTQGNLVEIYYFRSGRQPDGLTTDDEFTPYVFCQDKLVAIGWAYFGGPKTQGLITP